MVGKNTPTRRAHGLILTYILGMGGAMALLGAIFGLFQINLQALLQRPIIVLFVAGFFALLALSMFDLYTLQAPRWLQRRTDTLNRQQKAGSYTGAAIMGALSILVVSPCATPVLTALLLYTAQTTPLKGALALFTFGFGTGLPLLLFASAFRQILPKAGNWMTNIKRLFGFLMLGIALWLITRILNGWLYWSAWAAYALGIAVYIDQHANGKPLARYLAGAALLAAIFCITQINTPTQSLPTAPTASFREVKTLSELETAIATSNRPTIVDFTADWCAACKVWESEIWHNARFTEALAPYNLIKIDVTRYTNEDKALFTRLNLVGPPVVIFYAPHSAIDSPADKIIGETKADDFANYLLTKAVK